MAAILAPLLLWYGRPCYRSFATPKQSHRQTYGPSLSPAATVMIRGSTFFLVDDCSITLLCLV